MPKSPKRGRILLPVGVAQTDAPPSNVKSRVIKRTDLPTKALGDDVPVYADEVWMKLVHRGTFQMGSGEGDRDERPERPVTLDDFWIDRYPVANRDYRTSKAAPLAQRYVSGRCRKPSCVRCEF